MSIGPVAVTLIGAGGAVLGSAISTIPNAWIARNHERHARNAEREREQAQTRLACRLVAQELAEAAKLLEHSARTGRFFGGVGELPTDTWERYQVTLAASIESPADWRRVTEAHDAITDLNWRIAERREITSSTESPSYGIPVEPGDDPGGTWLTLRYAIVILEMLVRDYIPGSDDDDLRRAEQLWPTKP